MSIAVKLVCLMLCIVSSRSIRVRNGAYENFVIEIQKDVSDDDCSQFISNLEKILSSSSQYLHSSLDGRLYFASIDIILPSTWSNNCVSNATVTSYNGAASDVQITKTHPIFGDDLWTQQSSGCGERGDQMFVSERAIRNDFENVEKKFANEFTKYRYGVFDVNGFEGDSIYPKCSASSAPICSDAMNVESQQVDSKYMPTKQNQMCDRTSRMDVILRNVDFNDTQRNQNLALPVFNYVRKMSTRYMVVLDDHIDIIVRDSYIFLRDAIRKWIEKDLVHQGTEVGIVKLHANNTKSTETFKHIAGRDDREEILFNLPWYPQSKSTTSKCNIQPKIFETITQMQERAKIHGDAISQIVLIAPGMYKCNDDVINEIVDAANDANIKIVTINYPNIGSNRVPMDVLAERTGGSAFTVIEKKRNEDQSLLTTFFEITNVFMHISRLYHHGDQSELPVEIYRKEIVDTSSGDSAKFRTTIDSFNVDDAIKNINFYTYIYERKDVGMFLDNGMSLTSPNHATFSTITDQQLATYHQLSIVGNLTGVGSWSYNIKRFYGNPQPLFVQVLAYQQPESHSFITARSWIKRPQNGGPNVIYAEVMQGNLPIIDALVEVTVSMPNGREEKIQLFDSGSGDPDVTRGDGIYSRYFAIDDAGIYKFQFTVSDNGNVAYSQMDRDPLVDTHCCGSAIITNSKQPVTPFTRHLTPITLFISQDEIDQERQQIPFIGRIGDLRVVQQSNASDRVTLEWTSPDTGVENAKIDYELRYATSLKDVVDHFDTIATKWNLMEAIPHAVGQGASVTLNLSSEPSLIGVPFYVAIRTINGDVLTGPVSNFVRIYVPKRRPTASPSYTHIDNDIYETDPSMEPMDDDEHVGIFQHSKLASIPWEILIPVIICCIIALIIIIAYCWCCMSRKRGFSDTKKPTKSPSKPSISVITPTTPSYQPQPVQQNQYHVDPVTNGSVHSYLVDIPDHHTIGLPMIDDDILKPDFSDHDKMLIEEMKQQQRFQQQQQQAMIDAYGDQTILSSTLTRNGQYLSPYESWSASTLLHEHEVRQSPLDHESSGMMYVDANGDIQREIVPPIPPHPYQHSNGYGYTTDARGPPPPQYSQVYRPLVRGIPGQGSMQSVVSSAMMNGTADKKIRNVTMV